MDAIREYILSVVAAAILCAVLTAISGKSTGGGKGFQLVSSLFLTFALIRPIAGIKLGQLEDLISELQVEAAAAAGMGESYYEETLADSIQQRTRAYILDKAQALDAALEVTVSLNDQLLPDEVILSGRISPYAKRQMQTMLANELGIPKERQIWIG